LWIKTAGLGYALLSLWIVSKACTHDSKSVSEDVNGKVVECVEVVLRQECVDGENWIVNDNSCNKHSAYHITSFF